jgi:hypothetical protein
VHSCFEEASQMLTSTLDSKDSCCPLVAQGCSDVQIMSSKTG